MERHCLDRIKLGYLAFVGGCYECGILWFSLLTVKVSSLETVLSWVVIMIVDLRG